MSNNKEALHFLLFSLFLLLVWPCIYVCDEARDVKDDTPSLLDMKYDVSHVECLLLAEHIYTPDLKQGTVVEYSEKDFVTKKDDTIKKGKVSYSFLVLQIILTGGFLVFMLYDLIFYLERSDTWTATLKNNYYLLVIASIKLLAIVILAIDIRLAFNKPNEGAKIKYSNKDFKKFNEKGWQVLKIFKDDAFKEYTSILYINAKKNKMILALQGSVSWRDWWYTNLPAVMHQKPEGQVKLMLKLIESTLEQAKKYQVDLVTITGHSLGGFLAKICTLLVAMHFEKENIHFRSVTYDSPGAKTILDTINCNTENNRIDLALLDDTSYLSNPNVINSLDDPTGTVYMIPDNLSIDLSHMAKFQFSIARLLFYSLVSYPAQATLLFVKKLLSDDVLVAMSRLVKDITYWTAPIIMFIACLYFIGKVEYDLFPTIKNIIYSYRHHSLKNFINASDVAKGSIDAVEVSYFPKYGDLNQGPGDLFLALSEGRQLRYSESIKKSPMGICYVKNKNNSNAVFLPIRNVLPIVRIFLQQIDKDYPDASIRNAIFQLLGLPINYVYNKQGILQGIESTKKDLDVHIIVDDLAVLLRKKDHASK